MKKKLLFILGFIISYFVIINQFLEGIKNSGSQKALPLFIVLSVVIVIATLIIFIMLKKNKEMKEHKIFLLIATIYGLLFMIIVPAIMGTDELPHFLRPYQIAAGDIIVKNPEKNETLIPKALAEFTKNQEMRNRYKKDNLLVKTDYNDKVNLWNGDVTSINYSPTTYIPQIIGMFLSKIFSLSPLLTLYTVRFLNFIFWLIIMYIAIKLFPINKVSNIILFTSPAVLSLVSTCSGDNLSTALMMLFISYIFHLKYSDKLITNKDLLLLGLISLLFCGFKMVYVLLISLLLILPKEKFGSASKKYMYFTIVALLCLFVDFGWYSIASYSNPTSQVGVQISYVLHHPVEYIYVLCNTYINDIYYYITNFFAGSEMCYGLIRINQLFVILYVINFFYSCKTENERNKLNLNMSSRIFMILLILAIVVLVSSALYVDWTASRLGIGASKIAGIQSRYFIVLMPLLISLLPIKYDKKISKSNIINFSVFMNMILIIDTLKSIIITII